jgi:hypothetical protein
MVTGLIVLLAALAGAPDGSDKALGCADHWVVLLDEESFENNGAGKTFSSQDLHAFWAQIAATLRRAIGDACDSGSIDASAVEIARDVVVHSASGATEPHIYAAGDRALHFEWIFAEQDLAIPPDPDIVAAATCWIDPEATQCTEMGD